MVTLELVTKQMKDGENIVKCTQHVCKMLPEFREVRKRGRKSIASRREPQQRKRDFQTDQSADYIFTHWAKGVTISRPPMYTHLEALITISILFSILSALYTSFMYNLPIFL